MPCIARHAIRTFDNRKNLKMKTVAILIDDSSNFYVDNVMQRQTLEELSITLRHEFNIQWIDRTKLGSKQTNKILLKQAYDILFLYNKSGTQLQSSTGQRILSEISKPRVSWLTEHPVTFAADYLASEGANTHYIFAHEHHADFMAALGSTASYSNMPFGGYVQSRETLAPRGDREYDVCIAASWRGDESANVFWKNQPQPIADFFDDVVSLQDTDDHRDVFRAYLLAARRHNVTVKNLNQHLGAMKSLYWYERKRERISLLKALCKTDLKVLLVGDEGWEEITGKSPNITRIDPCSHTELTGWYLRSKAVACTNNFNGANERIFDAIGAGALPIMEGNNALANLIGNDMAFTYKPNHFNKSMLSLPEWLSCRDSSHYLDLCHDLMAGQHAWKDRAQLVAELMSNLIDSSDHFQSARISEPLLDSAA